MMNFWARYDLSKAAAFMAAGGWRLQCAVLTIGPLGFAVIWKRRADAKAGDYVSPCPATTYGHCDAYREPGGKCCYCGETPENRIHEPRK